VTCFSTRMNLSKRAPPWVVTGAATLERMASCVRFQPLGGSGLVLEAFMNPGMGHVRHLGDKRQIIATK